MLATSLLALPEAPGLIRVNGTNMLGAAAPVPVPAGVSGMVLAVLEDEERDIVLLRRRFLEQLVFHSALLGGTLLIFIFLLRRSYHSLLAVEERLRHQETMAALGSASQLIAHEVKNALNGIQAALSLLRPVNSSGEVALPALRAQMHRLGHLARSLLSFGAPLAILRRPCELRLLRGGGAPVGAPAARGRGGPHRSDDEGGAHRARGSGAAGGRHRQPVAQRGGGLCGGT